MNEPTFLVRQAAGVGDRVAADEVRWWAALDRFVVRIVRRVWKGHHWVRASAGGQRAGQRERAQSAGFDMAPRLGARLLRVVAYGAPQYACGMRTTGLLVLGLLALAGACGHDEVAFRLELSMTETGVGVAANYVVDGEPSPPAWARTYDSIDRACQTLEDDPLVVECRTSEGGTCGLAEVTGVCCWARAVLDSPIERGEVAIGFRGQQRPVIDEGHCRALDGTSTHGDSFPDAGI